jgi:hypothetical protein
MTIAQQRGIDRHVFLAPRPDSKPGLGTSENPFRVRDASEFDARMRTLPERVSVELASGYTFETMGHTEGDGNPLTNWSPKAGWDFGGSGMGDTVLKIVGNDHEHTPTQFWNHTVAIGGNYNLRAHGCCIHDLTIDCNLDGQPLRDVACGAIYLPGGNHVTVERVRAINFGTRSPAECFVISLVGGHKEFGEAGDLKVKDCVLEQPCPTSVGGGITGILLGGVGQRAVVRGNFIEGSDEILNGSIFHGVTTALDHSVVEGNFLRRVTDGWYADAGQFGRVEIRDNEMEHVAHGLRVDFFQGPKEYRIESLKFSRNKVFLTAMGRGVDLAAQDPARLPNDKGLPQVEIGDNRFHGGEYGVAFYRCGQVWVHDNKIGATDPNKRIVVRQAEGEVPRVERNVDGALADANEVFRP